MNMEENQTQNIPGGGTPSQVYLLFVLSLCKTYFNSVVSLDSRQIDGATAALISFVPDRETRNRLWTEYTQKKNQYESSGDTNTLGASVFAVGEVVSHLSEVLEFTTTSSGAFL
jgi:hypothetical protein